MYNIKFGYGGGGCPCELRVYRGNPNETCRLDLSDPSASRERFIRLRDVCGVQLKLNELNIKWLSSSFRHRQSIPDASKV